MVQFTRSRLIWFIVLLLAVVVLEFVPPVRQIFSPALRLAGNTEGGLYRIKENIRLSLERLIIGEEVSNSLTDLKRQIEFLTIDRAKLATLEEENKDLRALTGFDFIDTEKRITTRVIGQDPTNPNGTLRIGLGSSAGVVAGAAVVSPNGILVGVVGKVDSEISTVELITNRKTQIPVKILSKDAAYGLLVSADGLSVTIDQMPKDEIINPGDIAVTNYGRAGVPPNIVVGTVFSVISPPEGLWQIATITPLVSQTTLDIVSVIVSSTDGI